MSQIISDSTLKELRKLIKVENPNATEAEFKSFVDDLYSEVPSYYTPDEYVKARIIVDKIQKVGEPMDIDQYRRDKKANALSIVQLSSFNSKPLLEHEWLYSYTDKKDLANQIKFFFDWLSIKNKTRYDDTTTDVSERHLFRDNAYGVFNLNLVFLDPTDTKKKYFWLRIYTGNAKYTDLKGIEDALNSIYTTGKDNIKYLNTR